MIRAPLGFTSGLRRRRCRRVYCVAVSSRALSLTGAKTGNPPMCYIWPSLLASVGLKIGRESGRERKSLSEERADEVPVERTRVPRPTGRPGRGIGAAMAYNYIVTVRTPAAV